MVILGYSFRQKARRQCIAALGAGIGFVRTLNGFGTELPGNGYSVDTVLPPMVVVAYPELPDDNPIADKTMLEKKEFAASGKWDLANQLRGQTGTSVTNVTRGTPNGLMLRGVSGGLGLLMVDDMPLYSAFTGAFTQTRLPVETLERAEIVRGAGAQRFGSQALGGTIRLFTRDTRESTASFRLEGGSFGTLQEVASGSVSGDIGRATASFVRDDLFDGVSHADTAQGNRERDRYRGETGVLHFAVNPNAKLNVEGSMLYLHNRTDADGIGVISGGRFGAVDAIGSFVDSETWLAQSTANLSLSKAWDTSLKLGFTQSQLAGFLDGFGFRFRSKNTVHLLLARWHNRHALLTDSPDSSSLNLYWGGEARDEQGEGQGGPRGRSFRGTRNDFAGFAGLDARFGRITGTAGVRVDGYSDFGTHPVFHAGAAWQALSALTLHANGGYGFRPPSFNEFLTPFFGNPALQPEQGFSFDFGADWAPSDHQAFHLSAFHNRFDDLIQLVFVREIGTFRSENIARTRIRGIETEWAAKWAYGLDSGIRYTFSDSRNLDTAKLAPLHPEHQGKVWLQWQDAGLPWQIYLETVVRSSHWSDNANTLAQRDSVRLNMQISYAWSKFASIYLRGENLNGDRNSDLFNFTTPGAGVYGGVRLGF